MKKQKLGIICSLCCISAVHAGTMGEVREEVALPSSAVFIAAEGGWTWNDLGGLHINIAEVGSVFTTKNVSHGSARISLGAEKFLCNSFAAIGEIGYGYYGRTHFGFNQVGPILSIVPPDFSQIHVKVTNDGFDVLAGLNYRLTCFDLYFKAGAMVQNSRYDTTVNLGGVSGGGLVGGIFIDYNKTQVFPEIKLGAGYRVCDNLSITASWMHVFGERPHITADINPSLPLGTIDISRQNPRLDTFLLGASYAFPV